MRGLAGLDGLLDQGQHLRREDAPHPPAVLHQMLADAFDAHNQLQTYQLPDAPPPPKLPPPPEKPPLSLELLLPPDQDPPPPPTKPPLRPPPPETKLSANIVRKKAMTADTAHSASDPIINHATTPMMPPAATEPISLPSSAFAKALRRLRHRQRLSVDHRDHPLDAVGNTAGKIPAPKFRRDDLADDPA